MLQLLDLVTGTCPELATPGVQRIAELPKVVTDDVYMKRE